MRLLRDGSGRVRASVRGALPAVATLALLLAAGVLLGSVLASADEASVGEGLLNLAIQSVLYVALIGAAVRGASALERRDAATFGLDLDARWLRDFAAGVLCSLLGVAASLWWGQHRGLREVNLAAADVSGADALVIAAVLAAYAGYFLLGNVYEEVVYRRVALGNFAEGLAERGLSPRFSVAAATTGSLVLFGLYHVPLRGNLVVAIDAALVGVTFALAYLLTDDLALAVGVHFGRVVTVFQSGQTVAGVEVAAVVALTRDTLAANLEVLLVELAAVCACVVAWVYLTRGELRVTAVPRDGD